MKSSKNLSKYILFTSTFLILTYICINTSYKFTLELKKDILDIKSISLKGRKLLTNEDSNRVCEKASENVKKYFETGTNPPDEAKFDDEKPYIQEIIQFIDGNGKLVEVIKKYIFHALPVILFLVLIPITLILWPVCIFCCLCNCCCCCCCKGRCCQMCSFFVAAGCFGLVVILSTVQIATTNKIFKNLSTTSCTIFKLFTEAIEGQPKTMSKPKWEGIDGLKEIIHEMSEAVDTASQTSKNEFADAQTELNEQVEEWEELMEDDDVNAIKNLVFQYTDYSCTGSSDELYEYITPYYIKDYGPATQVNTQLYYANLQFETVTREARDSIVDASEKMDKALKDGVSNQLNDVQDKIDDLGSKFNELSENVGDKWLKYEDKVDKYGKKYTKIAFSIIMGLCAILLALIILNCLMCCPLSCLIRILIHILWNVMYLLAIISFILGTLTGLLGLIGKDGSSIVHFTISKKNLESEKPFLLGKDDTTNYINTCVNGDGNLKEAFDVGEIMDDLDDLYQIKDTIKGYRETINDNNTLFTIDYINSFSNGKNILPMAYYQTDILRSSYDNFIKITEAYNTLNDQTKSKSNLDDFWAFKKENTDGYIYKEKPNILNDFHDTSNVKKYLLSLNDDWDYSEMSVIYEGFPTLNQKITNCMKTLNEVQDKITILHTYSDLSIPKNLKDINTELNNKYKDVLNTISDALDVTTQVIEPLYDVLNEYLGDDASIYELLNCKFLGNNIKVLLTEMHSGFGKNFYNFGFTMGLIGLLTIIGIYCTILTISISNSLKKKDKKEEPNTEVSSKQYKGNGESEKFVLKENN